MYKGKKVALVIPAYNVGNLIAETLNGIPKYADRIFVVDDGSTDTTAQIARSIADRRITVISYPQNQGTGAAVVGGYEKAIEEAIDIIVRMDGDNQMNPDYLPDFLDPIVYGQADYAKGNRLALPGYSKGMSRWRLFGNKTLTLLTKIASGYREIEDSQNGYTAIAAKTLKKLDLNKLKLRRTFENAILIELNIFEASVVDVPHPAKYGREKSSIKYSQFIVNTSWLLFTGFLHRILVKSVLPRVEVLSSGKKVLRQTQ